MDGPMPTDERVLVIPTARFRDLGYFFGFCPVAKGCDLAALLDPTHFQFRPRSEVETDPAFKQLIPYVVLRSGSELFHYRRGAAGTETRLKALRSVGIGGHISEGDAAGTWPDPLGCAGSAAGAGGPRRGDPYRTGMLRELTEEVELACGWRETFLGFINDDRTPVGQVHLGVVHLFDLDAPAARSREDALAEAGFAPLAELAAAREQFETWSQIVLAELAGGAG
ncbi:MAG TPA: phosphoesterase [Gemmataceae bacterium]|nr:phosphoesterase [Gemmataceae bacterium]